MKTFGAQYCVYEDSGFLAESVLRIYPLVKKILFLVGFEPWYGKGDLQIPKETLAAIFSIYDPDHKFVVVSKYWKTEAAQRNEGLRILHDLGCEWCLIVDDDEMFNRWDLQKAMEAISNATYSNGEPAGFLVQQLIYWKDRQTVIDSLTGAMPAFVITAPGHAYFGAARNFSVVQGIFSDLNPNLLICHHLSYVRDEGKMRRKLGSFSHAPEIAIDWMERVWLAWKPGMEDLHPNPGSTSSFKRAVPAAEVPWLLEALPGRLRPTPR
jgi:hypothetical protein